MHGTFGMASRAEASESAFTPAIKRALGHDAAGGIARAQEQHIEFSCGHYKLFNRCARRVLQHGPSFEAARLEPMNSERIAPAGRRSSFRLNKRATDSWS